jgi:hypothetical protein
LPVVLISAPIALLVRAAARWHAQAAGLSGLDRLRSWAWLLALMAAIGLFAGSWSQMPPDAQAAVRQVNRQLQFMLDHPDQPLAASFKDIPGLRARATRSYTLSERPASTSPTAVEVAVQFSSGYAVTCLVDHRGSVPLCFAGSNLFGGPTGGSEGP